MALTLMMRSGLEIKMTTAKFPNDCDNCIYIGLFQHYIKERGFRREDTGEFVEHGDVESDFYICFDHANYKDQSKQEPIFIVRHRQDHTTKDHTRMMEAFYSGQEFCGNSINFSYVKILQNEPFKLVRRSRRS